MTRFSEKSLTFLKTFYSRQETALEEGTLVKKAALYREIFEKPNMSPASATTNANKILKRFEQLSEEERNKYFSEWKMKAKEKEIKEMAENIKIHKAYIAGQEESNKKFEVGFLEGVKAGKKQIQKMVSVVDFSTEEGQRNYLEGIATLFLKDYDDISKISFFDVENKRYISNAPVLGSIVSGLVDIAKLNLQKFHKSTEFAKQMLAFKKKMDEEMNK